MSDGYYITLKNVRMTDEGLYVCGTFENGFGSDVKVSNSLELVVAGRKLNVARSSFYMRVLLNIT